MQNKNSFSSMIDNSNIKQEKDLDILTLEVLLESLEEQDKDIVVLWYIHGYTLHEIAAIITDKYLSHDEKPLGARNIGIRIQKVIKKLRENVGTKRDLKENA